MIAEQTDLALGSIQASNEKIGFALRGAGDRERVDRSDFPYVRAESRTWGHQFRRGATID